MKILGKRSLSSGIRNGLIILLIIAILITISVGTWIILEWEMWMENILNKTIAIAYLSSFPVIIMVVQFIKIFQNLKNEKAFEKENTKSLKISYIASFIICAIYLINTIIILANEKLDIINSSIVYPILMGVIATVFFFFGIGLLVLAEIYKKAIQFKEENELTI